MCTQSADLKRIVAPRKGRVSRNQRDIDDRGVMVVAPRKGRVSRNLNQASGNARTAGSRPARGV